MKEDGWPYTITYMSSLRAAKDDEDAFSIVSETLSMRFLSETYMDIVEQDIGFLLGRGQNGR
jgi:hypothetical protein